MYNKAAPDMSKLDVAVERLESMNPIKRARTKLGISQRRLAEITGIHAVTIALHEQGRQPSIEAMRRYQMALGIPLDDMVFANVEQTPLRVE